MITTDLAFSLLAERRQLGNKQVQRKSSNTSPVTLFSTVLQANTPSTQIATIAVICFPLTIVHGSLLVGLVRGGSPCHHCMHRLHHHDIMTTVGLFIYVRTICYNMLHNVGALKVVNLDCSHQQCIVAEWSGRSDNVRVRARAREWVFPFFFFLCVKV